MPASRTAKAKAGEAPFARPVTRKGGHQMKKVQPDIQVFHLRCFIEGSEVFAVEVEHNSEVQDLKKIIQSERALSILKGIDPHVLELYKVNINLNTFDPYHEPEEGEKLNTWEPISHYWLDQPLNNHLHVIIKVPSISPSSSTTSDTLLHNDETWATRENTTQIIYNMLEYQRLVHVRGTPGSGKTTLMKLLSNYIIEVDPKAEIKVISSWPHESDGLPLQTRLAARLPGVLDARKALVARTYILIDNGQYTYWDEDLWENFFKEHQQRPRGYRIILFCSYGSPSTRPVYYPRGTPPIVSARISLHPSEICDVGLLLTREEFDDVVSRSEKVKVDSSLRDLIFDSTAGHVGAIIDMLETLAIQFIHKRKNRNNVPLTVEDFGALDKSFFWNTIINQSAFGRGLPTRDDLSVNDVTNVFQELLLRNGSILRGRNDSEAVVRCHQHGWIHAEAKTQDETQEEYYTFPSPLHQSYFSWRLMNSKQEIQHTTVLELAIAVIGRFIPSQLLTVPRQMGSSITDRPPEAQYQQEFYRGLVMLAGGAFVSPEFGTERGARPGRIDFFIRAKKWGIELLRDGSNLLEHGSRFQLDGAYGTWLPSKDMVDYLILDFRSTQPKIAHSAIQNLYHVVFGEDYNTVQILDNNLSLRHSLRLVEN